MPMSPPAQVPEHVAQRIVHVNSGRHRLLRVAQVTGRDPLDFADRVALTVALRAWSAGALTRSGETQG